MLGYLRTRPTCEGSRRRLAKLAFANNNEPMCSPLHKNLFSYAPLLRRPSCVRAGQPGCPHRVHAGERPWPAPCSCAAPVWLWARCDARTTPGQRIPLQPTTWLAPPPLLALARCIHRYRHVRLIAPHRPLAHQTLLTTRTHNHGPLCDCTPRAGPGAGLQGPAGCGPRGHAAENAVLVRRRLHLQVQDGRADDAGAGARFEAAAEVRAPGGLISVASPPACLPPCPRPLYPPKAHRPPSLPFTACPLARLPDVQGQYAGSVPRGQVTTTYFFKDDTVYDSRTKAALLTGGAPLLVQQRVVPS